MMRGRFHIRNRDDFTTRFARNTDPSTSHDAAKDAAVKAPNDYAIILGTLAASPKPMTASEIDREHRRQGLVVSPAHKRLAHMNRMGLVSQLAQTRPCGVTGKRCMTWMAR